MSFRRSIFDRFRFDTNLYFNKSSYYDEYDLIFRINSNNIKTVYTDKAIVNHFLKYAGYRKRMLIGAPLNQVYLYAKGVPLARYYLSVFNLSFFRKTENMSNDNEYRLLMALDAVRGLISLRFLEEWDKIPYMLFSLFVTIPAKAKVKSLEEKRMLKPI